MDHSTTIVHVAAYYPPHMGGLERVAKGAADGLAGRGYDVRVFTSNIGMEGQHFDPQANPRVTALRTFEFAHVPFTPALFWRLMSLPKNSLIHLHLAQAYYPERVLIASKLRGIPYVVHFHLDVQPSGTFGALFVLYKKMTWGPLLRNARGVIACSEAQAALIMEKYRVPAERITVIPNAVGEAFFLARPYAPSKDRLRLLFVGRLNKQKRADRLIDAMKLLTVPAHLTIAGDGEDRPALEERVRRLGLPNVSFAGAQDEAGIRSYLAESDALVISSENEGGTPLVILEAMAAGLPVVGADVSGIHEFLEGGAGVLVGAPFPEQFAQALSSLWKSPAIRTELSGKSLEKARTHTWTRFIDALAVVYDSILP